MLPETAAKMKEGDEIVWKSYTKAPAVERTV